MKGVPVQPIPLPSNQPPDRFYLGGPRISAFRHEPSGGTRSPEDWVASTTMVRGQEPAGLTRLPGGALLADEIAARPQDWLGPDHVRQFGVDTKLLVKLLDAGQRLPVHAHPDTAFASSHLGTRHGKAEAWYLLEPGEVFLGLRRDVTRERLMELVRAQEVEQLLDLMHKVDVDAHQTVYVPPGLLHAIGEGILLAEVQEPEDLSILLEWRDFDIDGRAAGHLGLGFDTALRAVETAARSQREIAELIGGSQPRGDVLAAASRAFFRLQRVPVDAPDGPGVECEAGFAVMIVVAGALNLLAPDGSGLPAGPGTTTLVPYAAGPFRLTGRGTALLARPPAA